MHIYILKKNITSRLSILEPVSIDYGEQANSVAN